MTVWIFPSKERGRRCFILTQLWEMVCLVRQRGGAADDNGGGVSSERGQEPRIRDMVLQQSM